MARVITLKKHCSVSFAFEETICLKKLNKFGKNILVFELMNDIGDVGFFQSKR